MVRRFLFGFLSFILLLTLLSPAAFAEDGRVGETLPDVYRDFLDNLPPAILERLPEGALSNKAEEVGGAVGEMSSFSFLFKAILSLIGLRLGDCLGLLCSVVGILILSSISRSFCASIGKPEISRAFSFMMTLIITVTIFATGFGTIESTVSYFHTLNTFTAASIPLMGNL